MASLPITPQVFAILSARIEERSGLHYDPQDAALLAAKVSPRAMEGGFESLLDYYYFLRYDPDGERELDALIETLVVHETYFFRELAQLRALLECYLAPSIARGDRPRIWCAAAATGEEPLTLAMLLAERDLLGRVELIASDISERALQQARRGAFGGRSLRAPPYGYERWLHVEAGRAVVAPELIERIQWRRLNLLDEPAIAQLGTFDVVLCRNVLIYFQDDRARQVVAALAERLRPGGVLVVGVSESLLRFGTLLRCEERAGSFFYEKAFP